MEKYLYKLVLVSLAIVTFSSCLWNDEDKTKYSEDANFVSLKFGNNDSIPNLNTAYFSLEYDSLLLDSVIVNLDSLPYKTRIDSVFPTFTFRSTSACFLIMTDSLGTGLDTVLLTGKDTIDFTRVKYVWNFPSLSTAKPKLYPVKVNVHQIEGELYVWSLLNSSVYSHSGDVQKGVYFNNKFNFYASSGLTNYLYTSLDGVAWNIQSLVGLPTFVQLRHIVEFNNKLMVAHEDGKVYSTADGLNWTGADPAVAAGSSIVNLLFVLEDNLWAIIKDTNNKYYFAITSNGTDWLLKEETPTDFPVSDYAPLSFKSRTQKPKAIVVGGYSANGRILPSAWSVQKDIYNKYVWVNFMSDVSSFEPLSGAQLITYDNKLLMFGGQGINGQVVSTGYRESIDEGLTWRKTDSIYNVIEDVNKSILYQPRSNQSVVLDEANQFIYLFGGRNQGSSGVTTYTDIWRGKLNRMWFKRK